MYPAHDSIIASVSAASPPHAASSTEGPFQGTSLRTLATKGEAPQERGSHLPHRRLSLCGHCHFPTVTPRPKAASSIPPAEVVA